MKPDFDVIEAIKERRSVRSFVKKQVEDSLLDRLAEYIDSVDCPIGTPPTISIVRRHSGDEGVRLGTYGVVRGASTYLCVASNADATSLMATGYVAEAAVLRATSMGLSTVWLGATYRSSSFLKATKTKPGQKLVAVIPTGYADERRLVEKIMRFAIKSDTRKPWSELFFNVDLTALTPDAAGEYATPLEMVRLAPSATNTQPWRIVKDGNALHFYAEYKPEKADSSDLRFRHIDMGIALCHFSLSADSLNLAGAFAFDAAPSLRTPDNWHYVATWRPSKL